MSPPSGVSSWQPAVHGSLVSSRWFINQLLPITNIAAWRVTASDYDDFLFWVRSVNDRLWIPPEPPPHRVFFSLCILGFRCRRSCSVLGFHSPRLSSVSLSKNREDRWKNEVKNYCLFGEGLFSSIELILLTADSCVWKNALDYDDCQVCSVKSYSQWLSLIFSFESDLHVCQLWRVHVLTSYPYLALKFCIWRWTLYILSMFGQTRTLMVQIQILCSAKP